MLYYYSHASTKAGRLTVEIQGYRRLENGVEKGYAVVINLREISGAEQFSALFPGNILVLYFSSRQEAENGGKEQMSRLHSSFQKAVEMLRAEGYTLDSTPFFSFSPTSRLSFSS